MKRTTRSKHVGKQATGHSDAATATLHEAKRDDVVTVIAALESGADPNAELPISVFGMRGITPLMSHAHPDILRALINAGADASAVNPMGQGVLSTVPRDVITTKMLVEAGADPLHVVGKGGPTTLMFTKDPEVAAYLMAAGVDPRAKDRHGRTALHGAPAAVAEVLVQAGAQVDAVDHEGRTPLSLAVSVPHSGGMMDRVAVIGILLAAGADHAHVDTAGRTVFSVFLKSLSMRTKNNPQAMIPGAGEIADLLMDAGADPTAGMESDEHVLDDIRDPAVAEAMLRPGSPARNEAGAWLSERLLAGVAMSEPMMKAVASAGVAPDVSVLSDAIRSKKHGWPSGLDHATTAALIALGTPIHRDPKSGATPLHGAIDGKAVKLLVGAGVNVDAKDKLGRTPLETATTGKAVRALLASGSSRDRWPLTLFKADDSDLMRACLDGGMDPDRHEPMSGFSVWRCLGTTIEDHARDGIGVLVTMVDRGHMPPVDIINALPRKKAKMIADQMPDNPQGAMLAWILHRVAGADSGQIGTDDWTIGFVTAHIGEPWAMSAMAAMTAD